MNVGLAARVSLVALGILTLAAPGCSRTKDSGDAEGSSAEASETGMTSAGSGATSESGETASGETETGETETGEPETGEADTEADTWEPSEGPECTCAADEVCVIDCHWIPSVSGPTTGVSGVRCVPSSDGCALDESSCEVELCLAHFCPDTMACFTAGCSISNMGDYDFTCQGQT